MIRQTDQIVDVYGLQHELAVIAARQKWELHHGDPRNLILALVGEVGELAELFQWSPPDPKPDFEDVALELADVQIYLARLFSVLGVDWREAINEKLRINAER